jgi:hypothetical protein
VVFSPEEATAPATASATNDAESDDDSLPPLDADDEAPKPPLPPTKKDDTKTATVSASSSPANDDESDDDSLPPLDGDEEEPKPATKKDDTNVGGDDSDDDSLPPLDGQEAEAEGGGEAAAMAGVAAKEAIEQLGELIKTTKEFLARDRVYKEADADELSEKLKGLRLSMEPLLKKIQTKDQIKQRQFASPNVDDGDFSDDEAPRTKPTGSSSKGAGADSDSETDDDSDDDDDDSDGSLPDLDGDGDDDEMPALDENEPAESQGLEELD